MEVFFNEEQQKLPAEVRIALSVEKFLIDMGWEVFREVALGSHQPRADLVARLGNIIWVIETKQTLSLHLLAQAKRWHGRAHAVSIACPFGRHDSNQVARDFLGTFGGGWLHTLVPPRNPALIRVSQDSCAKFSRRISLDWNTVLHEEQKTYCDPGVQSGAWTPFKATIDAVKRIVLRAPGITLRGLVEELRGQHHYKSDAILRVALPAWIRNGSITDIVLEKSGGLLRLFHKSQQLFQQPATKPKSHHE